MILVLSDIHIGRKWANWREAIQLMKNPRWDKIILCGDTLDLWYKPIIIFTLFLLFLSKDIAKKTVYVIGNHDNELDDLLPAGEIFQCITPCYELTINNCHFTFVHGHETDFFNSKIAWFGQFLTWIQSLVHKVTRVDTHALASSLIERLRIRRQRKKLMEKYLNETDVLVSGHTHVPGFWTMKREHKDPRKCFLQHYNAGDWVRHRTYLTIDDKGVILQWRLPD